MSQYFGYCKKHKIQVTDYCPKCEKDVEEQVRKWKEQKGNDVRTIRRTEI